jgi:hypothetical protein
MKNFQNNLSGALPEARLRPTDTRGKSPPSFGSSFLQIENLKEIVFGGPLNMVKKKV